MSPAEDRSDCRQTFQEIQSALNFFSSDLMAKKRDRSTFQDGTVTHGDTKSFHDDNQTHKHIDVIAGNVKDHSAIISEYLTNTHIQIHEGTRRHIHTFHCHVI